jgi:hypothetical protein
MLSPHLRSLLLATVLTLGSGCGSGNSPTAPTAESPAPSALLGGTDGGLLGTGLGHGLLTCTPLPYSETQQTVGPAGGTIEIGPHTLTIPAGALSSSVVITAQVPSEPVNSVRLQPEGLAFAPGKPARLTLSYANCSLVGQLLPKQIVYTTDLLQILQWLLSLDDPLHRRVSANLEHFSRYAVAW